MKAVNIIWDVDEGEGIEFFYGLPGSVDIPDTVNEEDVADWLSDKYGFCIYSYGIEK